MKQIQDCFDRHFEGKPPLKKKWQLRESDNVLFLFHYHHLIMIYEMTKNKIMYEWWERPADKRGLDAAKAYCSQKFQL